MILHPEPRSKIDDDSSASDVSCVNSDMIGTLLAVNTLQDDGGLLETTGRVRAKTKVDAGTQTLSDELEV